MATKRSGKRAGTQEVPGGAVLDAARGLAMVGVIYAHLMQVLSVGRSDGFFSAAAFDQGLFVASFLIPLFFLVSGAGLARIETKSARSVLRTSVQLVAFSYLAHFVALLLRLLLLLPGATPHGMAEALDAELFRLVRGVVILPPMWFFLVLAAVRPLLYMIVRSTREGGFWMLFAAIFVLSLASSALPSAFYMESWPAALLFLMLGYKLAPHMTRVSALALLPAAAAAWLLAPLNHGCAFDPVTVCPIQGAYFFVHFPTGDVGFLPLFYLTAAAGCVAALSLARVVVRARLQVFGALGRKTLQIAVVHGFVMAFLFEFIRTAPIPPLSPLAYPAMGAAMVAGHFLLVRLLAAPLKAQLRASLKIADGLVDEIAVNAARRVVLRAAKSWRA